MRVGLSSQYNMFSDKCYVCLFGFFDARGTSPSSLKFDKQV